MCKTQNWGLKVDLWPQGHNKNTPLTTAKNTQSLQWGGCNWDDLWDQSLWKQIVIFREVKTWTEVSPRLLLSLGHLKEKLPLAFQWICSTHHVHLSWWNTGGIMSADQVQALLPVKGVSGACWELIAISSLLRLFKADKDRQAGVRNYPTETSWTDSCFWNLVIGVAGGPGFLVLWSCSEVLPDGSGGEPRGMMIRGRCAVTPWSTPVPIALLDLGTALPSAA